MNKVLALLLLLVSLAVAKDGVALAVNTFTANGKDFVVGCKTDETVNLTNNWWNSTSSTDIRFKLIDGVNGGQGTISYSPFLSAPAAEAPAVDWVPFVIP